MMTIPERYRIPIVALVAVVLVVAAGGAIVLVGGGGPAPSSSPSASLAPSPSDPGATPESAVRAFFDAYSQARKTDDPSLVVPFVTSTSSSAYLSAAGFLNGEKAVGKASITTVLRLDNMQTVLSGTSASVSFDYTEGGYDISATTGMALETPTVLAPRRVVAQVHQVGGRWLVDDYTATPEASST